MMLRTVSGRVPPAASPCTAPLPSRYVRFPDRRCYPLPISIRFFRIIRFSFERRRRQTLTLSCICLPLYIPQFKSTEHAANLFALKELGNIYSRLMNPTTHVLETRVSQLEGGHPLAAVAVASGTSAVFYSIINLAQAGDNIVASSKLYGGTYTQFNDILPSMGITVKFVDAEDPENFRAAIDDKTRALFCETVSNPALEIVDLEAVSAIGHEKNIPLIVDSTFSTPYLTNPFTHGADIIVSSLTKWIGGHGTGIGGIAIDKGGFNWASGRHPVFDGP